MMMFRIGDFSRLGRVTVKALRHYDRVGLLRPALVDPATGYRHYSADQMPRLSRILALKEAGLSLEEIATILGEDLPTEELLGILKLKRGELAQRIRDEETKLRRLETLLSRTDEENGMSSYDVTLKKTAPVKIASLRGVVPTYGDQGMLWNELCSHPGASGKNSAGAPFTIYYDEEYKERDVDLEVCVPVTAEVEETDRIMMTDMAGGEEVASVIHKGPFENVSAAYKAIMEWMAGNGYETAGPSREVYLTDPQRTAPEDYITEVQVPVRKM
jgi:effector-binding domain-containing protein